MLYAIYTSSKKSGRGIKSSVSKVIGDTSLALPKAKKSWKGN